MSVSGKGHDLKQSLCKEYNHPYVLEFCLQLVSIHMAQANNRYLIPQFDVHVNTYVVTGERNKSRLSMMLT